MRYGTRTAARRYWTPAGIRPDGSMNIGYEYGYLYTALSPATGDLFALMLPTMQKECFEVFVEQFQQHLQQRSAQQATDTATVVRLVLDNAGAHHAELQLQHDMNLEFLPAYSPELNPVERFFQELRRAISGQIFETLQQIEQVLTQTLHEYWNNPRSLVQLTHWDWMVPEPKTDDS